MPVIIEKGLPVWERRRGPITPKPRGEYSLALERMDIGDSFGYPKDHRNKVMAALHSRPILRLGRKYVTRTNGKDARVWRVK